MRPIVKYASAILATLAAASHTWAGFNIYNDVGSFTAATTGVTSQTFTFPSSGDLGASYTQAPITYSDIGGGFPVISVLPGGSNVDGGSSTNTATAIASKIGAPASGLDITFAGTTAYGAIGLNLMLFNPSAPVTASVPFVVTLYDVSGNVLPDSPLVTGPISGSGSGTFYGVVSTASALIHRINLHITASGFENGLEGVTGVYYGSPGTAGPPPAAVPAPPTLVAGFLGMAMLSGVRSIRRRKTAAV